MDRSKLSTAAFALFLPALAHAQGGWYAGVDVGDAKIDAKIEEYVLFGGVTDRSRSSTVGYRLHGGYQFGRFFALELAYVDFGEIESHFEPNDCPYGARGPCPLDLRTSISGVVANMVGLLPLGEHWFLDA